MGRPREPLPAPRLDSSQTKHGEEVHQSIVGVKASAGITVTVDGVQQQDPVIPLADDRREHKVEVRLG
jgi:hypothetical protein